MRIFKYLILLIVVSFYITGCSEGKESVTVSGNQDKGEDVHSKEEHPIENKDEDVNIPTTITLTYNFNGTEEKEEAAYWEGQNGYYLYVPSRVEATNEEPGKDLIMTNEIPQSTIRLEVFDVTADIDEQKQMALDELAAVNSKAQPETVLPESSMFIEQAAFQASIKGENSKTMILFLPVEDRTIKITTLIWDSEEQWVLPVFKEVIKYIGIL